MSKHYTKNNIGFTVIELIISLSILMIIGIAITAFQQDIFVSNRELVVQLKAQEDARKTVESMLKEFRTMSPSELGGYPISQTSSGAITFYTDTNGDNIVDQVRYFIENGNLKRGVIEPTGDPLAYLVSNEVVTILAENVNVGTKPLFEYFDRTYMGAEVPLPQGLSNIEIRFRGETNSSNEEVRIDDVAVKGDTITLFSDSFGSSSSNTVSGWTENETSSSYARISTHSSRPNSPTTGHVRLRKSAYITKIVNVAGYNNVTLEYYWRGDNDAESSDQFFVEWRKVGDPTFTVLNTYSVDPPGCSWWNCPWSSLVTTNINEQIPVGSGVAAEISDITFIKVDFEIQSNITLGNVPISIEVGVTLRNLRRGL